MKIYLCGWGQACKGVLKYLLQEGHKVVLFTHDNPDYWGEHVRDFAAKAGVDVHLEDISSIDDLILPDLIVSIYYRNIIKPHLVDRMENKIINCHTSLLPKHAGRSSVPFAIMCNDSHTGITYHYIDNGIDTGRILLQAVCQIDSDETQTTLFEKINRLAVEFFPAALELAVRSFKGVEQVGVRSYHSGLPNKGEIDPSWHIGEIKRFIQAMTYPPLPYARFRGVEIRTIQDYLNVRYY